MSETKVTAKLSDEKHLHQIFVPEAQSVTINVILEPGFDPVEVAQKVAAELARLQAAFPSLQGDGDGSGK